MNRFQLGDEVPIQIQCRDADGTADDPDAAPALGIYSSASALVESLKIPPKDANGAPGLFEHFIRLDSTYVAGTYSWRADWLSGGAAQVASGVFHVVAGGDDDGTVISAEFIDKGGSRHLWQHLAGNAYRFGHNPRL